MPVLLIKFSFNTLDVFLALHGGLQCNSDCYFINYIWRDLYYLTFLHLLKLIYSFMILIIRWLILNSCRGPVDSNIYWHFDIVLFNIDISLFNIDISLFNIDISLFNLFYFLYVFRLSVVTK